MDKAFDEIQYMQEVSLKNNIKVINKKLKYNFKVIRR